MENGKSVADNNDKIDVKELLDFIWTVLYEDKAGFNECADILRRDNICDMTGEELEYLVKGYFFEITGLEAYEECPLCNKGIMVPRRSGYNKSYFLGCNKYPGCKFFASETKKYEHEFTMEEKAEYKRDRELKDMRKSIEKKIKWLDDELLPALLNYIDGL
jgi:hypothetical protein